ncbi:hypothetical protein N7462_006835 [Penicillium macrosclerotiorum]|uniref:uncharacterized protein n=1 Tax=Penicillium macrosclerotiorum TaxID=303699 RepID=UPI0025482E5B|nr:uncharacterized protein N7462_006835 [Penicillium macrosclerotiorum]KAJ5678591.1 hypothetical protein N7462_006835 [Penicillium macrosclerotiorum]
MKFISITIAIMAALTANVAARRVGQKWCGHPGQGCYMMKRTADITGEVKRSADALAEAMAEAHPEALQKWCVHPGQGCTKIKRTAEAVEDVQRSADALAEAMAAMDEEE